MARTCRITTDKHDLVRFQQGLHMQRRSLLLAAPSLWLGGATALLASPAHGQSQVVRFGQSASLSGGQAGYGKDVRDGILAAFAAANKADGGRGMRFELVTLDDGGERGRCAKNVGALIDSGAAGLIGLTSGAGAEASMQTVDQAQIALLGTASGNMGIRAGSSNLAFHVRAGYDLEYRRMAAYMRDFGLRRVGVVYLQDASKANLDAMNAALSSTGVSPAVAIGTDRNGRDFSEVAATLLSARLDCVLFSTNAAPVAAIIDQMNAARYGGLFYASSFAGQDLVEALASKGQSCIFSSVVPRPNALNVDVVNRCQQDLAALGGNAKLGMTTLEGYVAGRIAIEAGRQALKSGPVTRARLREALAGLRADLGGYKVDFNSGAQGSRYVDLIALDRYGRMVGNHQLAMTAVTT